MRDGNGRQGGSNGNCKGKKWNEYKIHDLKNPNESAYAYSTLTVVALKAPGMKFSLNDRMA